MYSRLNNEYKNLLDTCDRISKNWKEKNYNSETFFQSVEEEVDSLDLSFLADIDNQMYLLENPYVRNLQHNSTFSDFNFQIYNDGRFFIEILNWYGGHVNPHDHDFSALQFQLKGNAINVIHDFQDHKIEGALTFGERKIREVHEWKEGDRSVVRFGDLDPHGVFHLNEPSTSLLIRTVPTPRAGFQNNYFKDLKAKYYVNSYPQRKKLTSLRLLTTNLNKFRELFWFFFKNQSYSENFFMILKMAPYLTKPDFNDILNKISQINEEYYIIVSSSISEFSASKVKSFAHHLSNDYIEDKKCLFIIASLSRKSDNKHVGNYSRLSNINNFIDIESHVEILMS